MNPEFFNFIAKPDKESFLKSREMVINHPDYAPYSIDLEIIEKFIELSDFESALNHKTINILLSPAAHLMKGYAARQLNDKNNTRVEYEFAEIILNCIKLTGNGSKEFPYIVTRVEDEYDFLQFIEEKIIEQQIVIEKNKIFDNIKTESGKEIYFDITDCYTKLNLENKGFD